MSDPLEPDSTPRPTAPAERDAGSLDATVDEARPLPPISPADVGSASRSCLAILILSAAILLVLCLAVSLRTLF